MSAVILDGRALAKRLIEGLAKEFEPLAQKEPITLATLRVGEAEDAKLYSRAIENLTKKVNVRYRPVVLPQTADENAAIESIEELNRDREVRGVMVFSPLPKTLASERILNAVDVAKDIEGRRAMALRTPFGRVFPPTALASVALVDETKIEPAGKNAVVVGRSDIVGKPAAILLLDRHATVTVCHTKTADLKQRIGAADILIVTTGRPELVQGDWIKPGAVVVDVGENVIDGRIVGDVQFSVAKERAAFISPVPGGVGPVTNVMLLRNLLLLAKWKR